MEKWIIRQLQARVRQRVDNVYLQSGLPLSILEKMFVSSSISLMTPTQSHLIIIFISLLLALAGET